MTLILHILWPIYNYGAGAGGFWFTGNILLKCKAILWRGLGSCSACNIAQCESEQNVIFGSSHLHLGQCRSAESFLHYPSCVVHENSLCDAHEMCTCLGVHSSRCSYKKSESTSCRALWCLVDKHPHNTASTVEATNRLERSLTCGALRTALICTFRYGRCSQCMDNIWNIPLLI